MSWLTDWRRKRVLRKHAIGEALWHRATARLSFLPRTARLKDLALLFLAEKQFVGAHDLPVTDEMRVAIAAQACLPILELGLDWYSGWRGIIVYPGDFRVRRTEVDEHGVVHEWDDDLAGEAMPGGPVVTGPFESGVTDARFAKKSVVTVTCVVVGAPAMSNARQSIE